ncbi:phage antirepressor [Brevibacillus laterosporus]|uniref:Phage antirepressor KilAC domain-containing protein n=1 Tax=Brevibacillus laterosporus TaxID=1465 RepID=A0AAP3DHC9_BRELA|nr:phage antirepressor KilAC domain-containing protein [Brevibacillus laterosporus]MCR8980923.1 phage antirepressor KilAC domain-containing protein [Brevibacillus laterosporus]MCZ0808078.1 phage antirepressor KilAC domain-containing protein [Brevibacillus laterosporus]MCZ0826270.1 phage antirepressor KilAC domain-containing protein [Brevibacillus laterosporus]MCZ0850153.1 phage antirepressor KilAC domain-containing protein [Brevibacillus laterosporus]
MNQLQTFKNNLFEVAVKFEDGEILFDAEKVAINLGFTDVKNGKTYVRWNRVNSYLPKNSPQLAKGDFIPEPLVYKLAFKAENAVAENFQDWLAIEVIPSIRKHGAYMTPDVLEKAILSPDFLIGLATKLKEEQQARLVAETKALALEQQVAEYEPKITYLDQILQSKDAVTVTQIAKDYGMTGTELNRLLNEEGIQYKQNDQWLLYRKYQSEGYTKSMTLTIPRSNGSLKVKMNTRWTQKGRLFIHELLKKRNITAIIDRKDIGA